jgi:hypothetical protein
MERHELEQVILTHVNQAVADATPKALLITALIDVLPVVRSLEELAQLTALPRASAVEIVHLRDILTSGLVVTRQ